MHSKTDISNSLQGLRLENKTICFHSSFKSFGTVEGGPQTIINAFVENGNTLLIPTFTYESQTLPEKGKSYPQNGIDLGGFEFNHVPFAFNAKNNFVSREMGIISATILKHPDRKRGNHPLNSFAALGIHAEELIQNQSPLNVYAPYKKLYETGDGYIILAGVDLRSCTPVHYAEEMAGRNLFRCWAMQENRRVVEGEVGSCSEGFEDLRPYVRNIERTATIGESLWRIYPFNAFINQLSNAIRENPHITHCDNAKCIRCNDAVKGGPILD